MVMIRRLQVLNTSSWNSQWIAAQQPLLEQSMQAALATCKLPPENKS
jgi:hypothetical protein